MKLRTGTRFSNFGVLTFAVSCLVLQNSAEGIICQLNGDMAAWRNQLVESLFNETYINYTLAANETLAKLVPDTNFSLTTALSRSFYTGFSSAILQVKDLDLFSINWNTSTYGMFGPKASIPWNLTEAIQVLYVRPLYYALLNISREYKYSYGMFQPRKIIYSAKGLESTNTSMISDINSIIYSNALIFGNNGSTTTKSMPYYIPESDCYADNVYLVNVTIFNNFTAFRQLSPSTLALFQLGGLYDIITKKLEEHFRSSINPFQGRFVRASVFNYLEGTVDRNASALVELYFVNAYSQSELVKWLDYVQFTNPLRNFLGVNYTYYKYPAIYKGQLRMSFPIIMNMANATTTTTSTTPPTTTFPLDLSVVTNPTTSSSTSIANSTTTSTTSSFSSTSSTSVNPLVVTNATNSTTSISSSLTNTPLTRFLATKATISNSTNSSSSTSTPLDRFFITNVTISTLATTSNLSSTVSPPLNATTIAFLPLWNATNLKQANFTLNVTSTAVVNMTTVTLEPNITRQNATTTILLNITTSLNDLKNKTSGTTTTLPSDDLYDNYDSSYDNNSTDNSSSLGQNVSNFTTVNQSTVTLSSTLSSTMLSTLTSTTTTGKNGTFTNSSSFTTPTRELATSTTFRSTTGLYVTDVTSSSTVRNVTNATTAFTPTSRSTSITNFTVGTTTPVTPSSTSISTTGMTQTTPTKILPTTPSSTSTSVSKMTESTTTKILPTTPSNTSTSATKMTESTTTKILPTTPSSTSTSATKMTESSTTKILPTTPSSTTLLSTRTTIRTTTAPNSTTYSSTTNQRQMNLTSSSTSFNTTTISSSVTTVKQSSAISTATSRKFFNATILSTNATTRMPINQTTFDPDPLFKPVAPVIRKVYNDKFLMQKIATMPAVTERKFFYTIALPSGICMILFSVMCLLCLNIDCVPPRKTKKEPGN